MIEVINWNILLQVILYIGTTLIWTNFIKNLLQKNFGLDIIAGVALVSTILAQQYLAGVVVLIMFWGGQFLEEYAMRRAKKELSLLLSKNPTKAHLKAGDKYEEIELEKIKPGDIVLIKPKEIVSVDGTLLEGNTDINESVLSGESEPILKSAGSLVFAGTENLSNPIVVKVLKFHHETKFNEIINLVKNNENNKARIVRIADQYSIYFTIITFLIAGATWFLTYDFVRVIAVLVVATPCPLLIATPVAIMSGMSEAYKRGVVVKTGLALETLSKVKSFVFDKTGTITFGTPKVVSIIPFGGKTENEILSLAVSLDQFSTHILAKALIKYSKDRKDFENFYPENFKEDFGFGVTGTIKAQEYVLGKKYFLETKGIVFDQDVTEKGKVISENGQMIIYLGTSDKVVGAVVFEDEVRPESKKIFEKFVHDMDIHVSILTGDNAVKAEKVAEYLSVRNVISESTPEEKLEYIKRLQKEGLVAMVGDGVNDAPALTQADVGIAISGAEKTASSEVSDIVVLSNSLNPVYDVYHVAKKTIYLARQSILIGMGASFVAMLFSGLGFIQPLNGALIQETIDVVVILNALRLSKIL